MTKTTTSGTQLVPSQKWKVDYRYYSGAVTAFEGPLRPAYARRTGGDGSITSQSGIDGRYRPCKHTHSRYTVVPLSTLPSPLRYEAVGSNPTSAVKTGLAYGYHEDVHSSVYPQFLTGCAAATVSLASVQWNALAASAVQAMVPSFTEGTSLVNFLLELKDFKDVFKYLATGFRKKLTRMNTFRLKPKNGYKEQNESFDPDKGKPLQWLSKRYLEYNFGWRPLFRDVVALYQSIRDFELRFKEMVRREKIPQQRYWGTTIPGSETALIDRYKNLNFGLTGGYTGAATNRFRVRVTQDASPGIRYHAAMRYRYRLPSDILSVGGKLNAYLDLLGVNSNPAILWNAIPFSFIVDWFFNVSKYLERLKVDNVQIQTEILDFCHSAKSSKAVSLWIGGENIFKENSWGVLQRLPLAETCTDSFTTTVYERKTGIPDFRTAILTSGLDLREFALAGALAGVRRGY